jgi:hypothetical protein
MWWRTSSWCVSDELTNSASEYVRLIFRDEGIAIGDLDQLPLWEEFGQPSPMFQRHHAVLCCPEDERWTVEGSQAFGCDKQVTFLAGTHVLREIAPDLSLSQKGV